MREGHKIMMVMLVVMIIIIPITVTGPPWAEEWRTCDDDYDDDCDGDEYEYGDDNDGDYGNAGDVSDGDVGDDDLEDRMGARV